jgi:hypothetical protein
MVGLRKTIDQIRLASVTTACLFIVTTCLAADISVVSSMPFPRAEIAADRPGTRCARASFHLRLKTKDGTMKAPVWHGKGDMRRDTVPDRA